MKLESILIVEDSEPDQFFNRVIIEDFDSNIEIHQAYDGKEALEMLAKMEKQPDLILLDINMPVMGGHEFLKHFCQLHKNNCTIAMLTSSEQQSDKDRVADIECVKCYLIKPLTKENLEDIKNS